MEGPTDADRPGEPAADELAAARDKHIQLVLNAFERELLTPAEYEYRLGLIEAAASAEEMRQIVLDMPLGGLPPLGAPGAAGGSAPKGNGRAGSWRRPGEAAVAALAADRHQAGAAGNGHAPTPRWEAVEAALAAAGTPRRTGRDQRWTALIVVGVAFLVLMVLGVVLALSTHPKPSGLPAANAAVATAVPPVAPFG